MHGVACIEKGAVFLGFFKPSARQRRYPAGTDENTKIRNARTRTPTTTAIRVHNQTAFRLIIQLHRFAMGRLYKRHHGKLGLNSVKT
jgi:hypothetical protein